MKRLGLRRLHALQDWRQVSIKSRSNLMTKMPPINLCTIVIILNIVKNMNQKKIGIHNRDKPITNKSPAKSNKLIKHN